MTDPAAAQWFCSSPQGNKGPFSSEQVVQLLQQGQLAPQTLIWREGFASWVRVADIAEFAAAAQQAGADAQQAGTPTADAAAAAAGPPPGHALPDAPNQDDYLDGIFVEQVKQSWARFRRHEIAAEVDEVLLGAVITATLDNGYALIDLESSGADHYLRFERLDSGARIIFKLTHHAETLVAAKVLGHEARVTIGYGERVHEFGKVWAAIKQELKGGYLRQPDPGIITVDGDISSQYIYVEVGLLWDIDEFVDPEDTYRVNYPKLTEVIGATLHALQKYLRGRLAV